MRRSRSSSTSSRPARWAVSRRATHWWAVANATRWPRFEQAFEEVGAVVRRRRRGLDPDTMAWIALDALAGNLAMDLAYGGTRRPAAVAALSLTTPCRPDLVDRVIGLVERGRASRLGDRPPAALVLDLLRSAR